MKNRRLLLIIPLTLLILLISCKSCGKCKHEQISWVIDKEATCIEDGYKHQACSDCDAKFNENTVIPATHNPSNWIIDKEATCTENGLKHQTCKSCGEIISSTQIEKSHDFVHYEKKNATCTEDGYYEYDVCKICGYSTFKVIERKNHNFENGVCTFCNALESGNIDYKLSENNLSYIINGIKNKDVEVVYIPKSYNGLPIVSIDDNAFKGCYNIKVIEIPDYVQYIGEYAFANCNSLEKVIFNSNTKLKDIERSAFEECISLKEIEIPDSVEYIGSAALHGCLSLENLTLPFMGSSSKTNDNSYLGYIFGANSYLLNFTFVPKSLKKITITQSTSINECAFKSCKYIETIVLSDKITSIYDYAFSECSNLKDIYIYQKILKKLKVKALMDVQI